MFLDWLVVRWWYASIGYFFGITFVYFCLACAAAISAGIISSIGLFERGNSMQKSGNFSQKSIFTPQTSGNFLTESVGKKKVKVAVIAEFPLRKLFVLPMTRLTDNTLNEEYLKRCMDSLSGANMSDVDREKFILAQNALKFPLCREEEGRNKIDDGCGKIITLMAKYCDDV